MNSENTNLAMPDNASGWKLFLMFSLCVGAIFTITDYAAADALSAILCSITLRFTGDIGKAMATIAIIVVGVGLFMGKLNWAVAFATALGIGLIFGGASIVSWLANASSGKTTYATGNCAVDASGTSGT